MDQRNFELAEQLVNSSYIRLAQNSINKRQKIMKQLLSQRQLPNEPLDNITIKFILDTFALMDSNNFDGKIGVGERQSRIFSNLVSQRHFYMGHGIGRSGDIMANQPKAAGSSLILQLTKYLTISALHQLNYDFVKDILPLPLATGMSLTLSLLTLSQIQPKKKLVIWSRIDQKTCLKAVQSANLQPIVVELKQDGDCLCTDLQSMQKKIIECGPENILALMSTTSCFAPRVPDRVDQIAVLAKKYGIFHVVNNAYGIWCSKIANSLKEASRKGQCTVVVQSTDKNFMVPVGGSFIFAKNSNLLQKISAKYPGRASGSPIVDLFITLLAMGKKSIQELKIERKNNFAELNKAAGVFAQKYGCKVLKTPGNSISIGLHLTKLQHQEQVTRLGSILYSKRVMGHRIVTSTEKLTKIGNLTFKNYGSHCDSYPFLPYMTFACAVGTKTQQITQFFKRLDASLAQLQKSKNKKEKILSKTSIQAQEMIVKQESKNNQQVLQTQKPQIKLQDVKQSKHQTQNTSQIAYIVLSGSSQNKKQFVQ